MMRRIKLYGALAKFVGRRVLRADVASAAEAVRFMVTNWPELEQHMAKQYYRVSLGTYDLSGEELHDPAGQQDISIVPVVAGAGAVGRILLGIALIGLAFIPGVGLAAGALTATGKIMFGIGLSFALGGIAQMLTPVPTLPQGMGSDQDPRKTYNFSGIQQTSRQGTPVPLCYGKVLCGSVVISAGIDTVQVKA